MNEGGRNKGGTQRGRERNKGRRVRKGREGVYVYVGQSMGINNTRFRSL